MALVLRIKRNTRALAVATIVVVTGAVGAAGAIAAGSSEVVEHASEGPYAGASRIESSTTRQGVRSVALQAPAGAPATAQDPSQTGQLPQGDPAQQTPPPAAAQQELLTPEERAALALVEQIIRDQEGVLMGTGFSYNTAGRRDPFVSLLRGVGTTEDGVECPAGRLEGFLISEIVLKAIATAQGRMHAMVTGPNQRAYFLEVGTQLCDGHVSEITPNEVLFEQLVQDMTGARRSREVTKQLTTDSGGGQTP